MSDTENEEIVGNTTIGSAEFTDIVGEFQTLLGEDFDVSQLIKAVSEAVPNVATAFMKKPATGTVVPGGLTPQQQQQMTPPPPSAPHPSGNGGPSFFEQKVAGVPVWGWAVGVAAVGTGVFLLMRRR